MSVCSVRMRVTGALKSLGVLLPWTEFVLYRDALGCLSSLYTEKRVRNSHNLPEAYFVNFFYKTKCKRCFISDSRFVGALYGRTFTIFLSVVVSFTRNFSLFLPLP